MLSKLSRRLHLGPGPETGALADIPLALGNVRFWGYSGHRRDIAQCLLLTQSGHWLLEFAVMHNATPSMVGYGRLLGGAPLRRRDFITLLGGASTWPLAARAQPGERVRLVGLLEGISADAPGAKARHLAFLEGLQQLGC